MAWKWRELARQSGKWLAPCGLVAACLAALYLGIVEPRNRSRGIASLRANGLAAVAYDSDTPAQPSSFFGLQRSQAILGGQQASMMAYNAAPSPVSDNSAADNSADRKLVRTAELDLVVQHPADSAEKIRALAERLGGYLETSQVSGDPDTPSASLTLRVPASRFEEARAEIRRLGLHVEDEKVEAQDVTRQYVDQDARLRNLRAQEEQYLGILKRASTVSDTLEVSEKLNEVRGQIEQQQAEFDALAKQTETVSITVSLRADADAQVFGLHWRPLYQLKIAAREGLEGFGNYVAAMTALAFLLPTILLWLITIVIGAAVAWRILRWGWRVLFAFPKSAVIKKETN